MGIGLYRHRVAVEIGTAEPDGLGAYTTTYAPAAPPDWDCLITTPTPRDMETVAAGTVITQATYMARGRFHPGLTTAARLVFDVTDEWGTGRTHVLNVVAVANPDFRRITSEVLIAEVSV